MNKAELIEKAKNRESEILKAFQDSKNKDCKNLKETFRWQGIGMCEIINMIEQLDEPKECEIKTVYKKDQITGSYCDDCDGHCECADCAHKDDPYFTYEYDVFDYNLCTSCGYKYGVFESTNNFCPHCGAKIKGDSK